MQERIGLIEDMYLKEMDAMEMRLRCVEEEKKKEIAEKEELKSERDQLLKELEGLKRNKEPIATSSQTSSVTRSLHTMATIIAFFVFLGCLRPFLAGFSRKHECDTW